MRIRTIKPEFFTHEALFEAESETGLPLRLAFIGLWCAADREGRFKWHPRRLGVQILPYDGTDFLRVLDALVTRGFLVKYRVGDECFGAIPSFTRHQVINNREAESVFPGPDAENAEIISNSAEIDASGTRGARVGHASKGEGKGREGKGKEGNGREKEGELSLSDGTQQPKQSVWEPLRIRVCKMMGRREATKWSELELAKLKEVHQSGTSEQDLETLEAYYQSGSQFLRRDVLTLLNNWNGEIDRAIAHKLRPTQQEGRYGTSTGSNETF